MKAIEYFQKEHQALLGVVASLHKTLSLPERDQWQVARVLRGVEDLRLATLMHIVIEDGDFYPRVSHCGHPGVEQQIRQIKEEGGRIGEQFDLYLQRWPHKRAMREYDLLCKEVMDLLALLYQRVTAEERLFAVIEELNLDLSAIQGEMDACRASQNL